MKTAARRMKVVLFAVFVVTLSAFVAQARAANDLPLAASSPLTGVAFDDKPLALPVQRNFQMAMLTASSELGRSCGKMETYGWRMSQTEQGRVNQIFNSTVDRLRLQGYTVTPQTSSAISGDLTLLTVDKPDRHFIFLWSAGELGLVMSLCETTAPVATAYHPPALPVTAARTLPPQDVVPSHLDTPTAKMHARASGFGTDFTPLGAWRGTYICAQGTTGGTLQIDHLQGKNFDGVFRFYATPKDVAVPSGAYTVYGQYDRDSQRILINPGKWLRRPANFYNTVMVGSFDPAHNAFSAYFQGVSGCTSFEARRTETPVTSDDVVTKKHKHAKHAAKKKKPVKKVAPLSAAEPSPIIPLTTSDIPTMTAPPEPSPAPIAPALVDDKKDIGGIPVSGGK